MDLSATRLVPGLALGAGAVALAVGVHLAVGVLSPLVLSVAFGAVVANTVGVPMACRPGVQFAARRLLRLGVVLLGFRLSFQDVGTLGVPGLAVVAGTVGATFLGTRWAGRRLGVSDAMSLLVATGFAICGASAIAAVERIADADDEEVAFAVALVTLCGTLSIVVLPPVGHLLGLGGIRYGNWVGASVHDIGQVVAAATPGGAAAVDAAVVVKLTRVLLLAPLVAVLSRRGRGPSAAAADGGSVPPVPVFVAGFVAAVAIRSTGRLSSDVLGAIGWLQTALLGVALFGLGCGVVVARLRRLGGRPFVLGMVSWVLVAGAALVGTTLLPG